MKKILALILCTILIITICAGCSASTTNNTVVTSGPDESKIVLSVGDENISVGEFRYYVYVAAMEKAYSMNPDAAEDIASFDWNQTDENGKPLTETILENAVNSVLRDTIMVVNAKKNGVALSEDEKKKNNQTVEGYRIQNGEEAFLLSANAMAVKDVESYKNLLNRTQEIELAKTEISENLSKYVDASIDLSAWKSDDKVTAQHVLITNESEKFSNPEATAQEVLEKAKNGTDFAKLIEEYNEDPGATAAGYTFGRGEMVKEFEDASFALDCGEISDVVKTEYGFHVIRRLAGLAELQNYWMKNSDYTVNKDVLAEISVEDIIKAATNAQMKLQQMSQSQNTQTGQ